MTAAPDSIALTGPVLQQINVGDLLVTPVGGTQAALNTLLGAGGTVVTGGTIAGPVTLTGTLTNSGTVAGGALAGPITFTGTFTNSGTITGGAISATALTASGAVSFSNASMTLSAIPTADPHVVGRVWANSGVLTISAG